MAEEEAMICGECDPDEENGEFRAPKIASRQYIPTKAEIDAHYPLHAECRSWCNFCVEGKAAADCIRKEIQQRKQ